MDPATGLFVLDGARIATVDGNTGVSLTSAAFGASISWFPYVLAVAVILFAFSTMISWSYYGLKAWTYMFGEGRNKEMVFKLMFCVFVVIGASMNLGPVIDFSDSMIFAMSVQVGCLKKMGCPMRTGMFQGSRLLLAIKIGIHSSAT